MLIMLANTAGLKKCFMFLCESYQSFSDSWQYEEEEEEVQLLSAQFEENRRLL